MDSITHIALGAIIGEAILGKQQGKRAMALGAMAQSIPDIDFVASFFLDTPHSLLAHRGFTHSFLFAILITPFVALIAKRWHPLNDTSFAKWVVFFAIQILIHLLLDSLNAYGIGWFEPFLHLRISFNVLFVADPFYSIWLGISSFSLLLLSIKSSYRKHWIATGLLISTLYLGYAFFNKYSIDRDSQTIIRKQDIFDKHYFTTPTPLNNWLWYIVVEDKKGYHIGYRSVFDRKDSIMFHYFPRNDSLLMSMTDHNDLKQLLRFSQGYYTAEQRGDTLLFNDLRFGQQAGWHDPNAKFVFHYYLKHPSENNLVVQRGRFANWKRSTVSSLYERIFRP
ncbi:MAG: metal-dependent hydrolase [Cyclobacteriaceae bacterium]